MKSWRKTQGGSSNDCQTRISHGILRSCIGTPKKNFKILERKHYIMFIGFSIIETLLILALLWEDWYTLADALALVTTLDCRAYIIQHLQ